MTTKKRFYLSWVVMILSAIIVISANTIFVPATSYIAKDLGVEEAAMSSNMVFSRISMIICISASQPLLTFSLRADLCRWDSSSAR